MRHLTKLLVFAFAAMFLTFVSFSADSYAQNGNHGAGFVDENGDGYNDNAPDHDGDGIPNGMDEDYISLNPNAGNGARGFVDEDGDGINDNFQDADADGIPNCEDPDYVKPQDGTGNKFGQLKGKRQGQIGRGFKGAGSGQGTGTGECDETGPKGKGQRGRSGK
jgi:hypothetical protein